jgi:NodT family efflux transporter outer membrane factor (OMF) lipoprotein
MNLSAQLADLYYLAIEQRAQILLTDQTIQRYQDSLQRVENRYRQGITAVTDLYQARQSLATAKASRMTFQQALRITENAIAVMLGNYPGMNPLPQQKQIPLAPPQLPAGVPATLLQHRPDLRASLLRVKSRDAETAAAIADRFPSFNLVGSFGRSRSDITGTLLSGNFWNLLLKLSQPLFDGGRRKAEVARSHAALAESVAAYQESVLRAFQEVEDALSGNRTTSIRIEHLMEQERATRATQRLALDRYLRGLSDYLPVLTAQVFHFNTQSQLLTARRQLLSQRISLARALGGNWMANQSVTDHQRLARQEMDK